MAEKNSNKTYPAILFDLDGTLISTTELIVRCFQFSLGTLGLDFSQEELRATIGKPLADQFRFFFALRPQDVRFVENPWLRGWLRVQRGLWAAFSPLRAWLRRSPHSPPLLLGPKDLQFISKRHMEYQILIWQQYVYAFKDLSALLTSLRKQNKRLAIVTSRYRKTTTLYLDAFQLTSFFDVIITPEDTVHHKPHGEPLLKAMDVLNNAKPSASHKILTPEDCLYVGDTLFDSHAAAHAGMDFFHVAWPSEAIEAIGSAGKSQAIPAQYHATHLDDLHRL